MLQKNIQTQYWVEATHWAVSRVNIDRDKLIMDIYMNGYSSELAMKKKKQPLDSRYYTVNFQKTLPETPEQAGEVLSNYIPPQLITTEIVQLFHSLSTLCYSMVQLSGEFSDATSSYDAVDPTTNQPII